MTANVPTPAILERALELATRTSHAAMTDVEIVARANKFALFLSGQAGSDSQDLQPGGARPASSGTG
jgi:hypothetical protein